MQLSLLQSRLAASLVASCLVIVLYLFLFAPQFAFAADLSQIPSGIDVDEFFYDVETTTESSGLRGLQYEPDFSLFDRGIIGRAADGVTPLEADRPTRGNLDPKGTIAYVFEAASVSGRSAQEPNISHELRRSSNEIREPTEREGKAELSFDSGLAPRQTPSKTLYISANTCNQPGRISPNQTTMDPPQLTLFVSTSSDNTSPGPDKAQGSQKMTVFDEGAVMFNTSLDGDVYFSISAPEVSEQYFDTTLPYNFASYEW